MYIKRSVFIIVVLLLTGCSTQVPRDGDFTLIKDLISARIPETVHWYQGGEDDALVQSALDNLLTKPLTPQTAVQIALLNNQRLQAEYAELGIAQAGLLSNPVLFSSIRFPKGGNGGNDVEFDIAKEFIDILPRPARQRIATVEFERAKLRVANADMSAEFIRANMDLQSVRDDLNGLPGLTGAVGHWRLGLGPKYQNCQKHIPAGMTTRQEQLQSVSVEPLQHSRYLANKNIPDKTERAKYDRNNS